MENFWIRSNGQNTLKGVEDDLSNPPVLPAHLILEFLSDNNQKARDDFLALLPSMTENERERLENIYAFSTKPKDYPQILEDKFQKSMSPRINTGNTHLPKTVNKPPRSKLRINQ
tara:strand:+ start:688 stop:1032 length:345 start_codon:yes stop_codon:yes gene_type:complete